MKPAKSALLSASAIRSAGSGEAAGADPVTVAVKAEPVSATVVVVGSPAEIAEAAPTAGLMPTSSVNLGDWSASRLVQPKSRAVKR